MSDTTSAQIGEKDNVVPGAATQPEPANTAKQTVSTQTKDNPATTTNTQATVKNDNVNDNFTVDYGDFGVSKEIGLEGEVAEILKDFGTKHKVSNDDMRAFVKKYVDFAVNKQQKNQADFENEKKGWEQANIDKYKTDVDNVYKKVDIFLDSKESGKALKSFLNDNDIGKHNVIVDFLYEISKDYSEDNAVISSKTGDVKEKDPYSVLYPED